jgi:UDP-2,3-diacylglucosamine hydrolase
MHVATQRKLGFPEAPTLTASPEWRCIDFLSDVHLHESLPRTTATLARYLAETPADALFILGDLFEAWVGDDMRHEPYEAACTEILSRAAEKRPLFIMVGNRDFLIGNAFLTACGATALPDPTVLHAFGQRVLLMHGDELCLADVEYLKFRTQVRLPSWQQGFLAHPLPARLAQARQMREASQAHQQSVSSDAAYADVDVVCAGDWMRAAQANVLIHGHTHRPTSEAFGIGTRHVLSDWDLDTKHGEPRAQVLRWAAAGFERIDFC